LLLLVNFYFCYTILTVRYLNSDINVGNFVNDYNGATRVWLFVGMSVAVLAIKYIIGAFIPDTPREVTIQLQRQNFIRRKIILEEKDDVLIKRRISSVGHNHPNIQEVKSKIKPSLSTSSTNSVASNKRSVFNDFRSSSSPVHEDAIPEVDVQLTAEERDVLDREKFYEEFLSKIRDNDNEDDDNEAEDSYVIQNGKSSDDNNDQNISVSMDDSYDYNYGKSEDVEVPV
jgi:hypothetical protein